MKIIKTIAISVLALGIVACGGNKKEYSETQKKIMKYSWKYDTNANLDNANNNLKEGTGVTSNMQLGGDVKAIGDFIAETLTLGEGTNKGEGLVYSKKYGSGFLSTTSTGWADFKDDKTLVLFPYDANVKDGRGAPIEYTIEEVTDERFVIVKKSDNKKSIYVESNKFEELAAKIKAEEKLKAASDTTTTSTAKKKDTNIPEGADESKAKTNWKKGEKVEIYWAGKWLKGSIVEPINNEGKIKIHWNDYADNWDEWVKPVRIQAAQK
jgi:hypothetical protein